MRALLLVGLLGCNPERADEPAPIAPEATCDAGDDAWVTRAMPVLWGRRPHGAAEIAIWSDLASTYGREAVVRAMMADQEAIGWWREWMTDALYVARGGHTRGVGVLRDAPHAGARRLAHGVPPRLRARRGVVRP
jgi:hypothetical protein